MSAHENIFCDVISRYTRQLRILVIPITCSGFIRSPDLPNAMS